MTTIAWDGKTLAADRKVTYGNVSDGAVTKIVKRKKDGALCGCSGNTAEAAAFKRWFLKGGKGDYPGKLTVEGSVTHAFILYSPEKLVCYTGNGWYEKDAVIWAEGSGWELALGAMAAGATATEAVHIASRFDSNTGSDVDTLELGK